MATIPPIQTILTTAEIRAGLDVVDSSFNSNLKGGSIDPRRAILINIIRKSVQHRYDLNPSDSTLRATGNYLFSLVAPALSPNTNLAIINLSAVAVSTTEIDLAWTSVPNATQYILEHSLDQTNWTTIYTGGALSFPDSGLTPATHYFYRIHATAVGFTDSPLAYADATTQSVVSVITVSYYYGSTDYFAALSGGTDAITYNGTLNITHNNPITITWPSGAANNMYEVIRVPIGESIKTTWFNTSLNQGTIPDAVFRAALQPIGLPLYTYYVSRVAMSLDSTNLTETFS